MSNMKISEKCKLFLRDEIEVIKLKPYLDSGGVPTIGAGCTYYENKTKVKLTDPPITRERAIELFDHIVKPYEECVNKTITKPMTQQQFDAFVIMSFNCGEPRFSKPCMVASHFNAGDMAGVKEWWIKSFVTAEGKPCPGLVNRRRFEWRVFESGVYHK